MTPRAYPALMALVFAGLASPALADQFPGEYNGPYIAVSGGLATHDDHNADTIVFDTNRDGTFNETVFNAAGANAFSPGFCNGSTKLNSQTTTPCAPDHDAFEYAARVGYDARYGDIVMGVLVEGSKSDATDSTTAFSSTPASYSFERGIDYAISARARIGYAPGNRGLIYVTGGPSYAKINHEFYTTNTANSFTEVNGDKMVLGFQAGAGAEVVLGGGFTLGMEYLFNRYKDEKYYVAIGAGTAPPTNAFNRTGGVNAQPFDIRFDFHSYRAVLGFRF